MEAHIVIQGKNDPPRLDRITQPVIDLSSNPKIIFCIVEGGMKSGEPSVMIVSEDEYGSVMMQTSLDKFLMAATGMASAAETRWNWKQPEGAVSIMPTDRSTQKAMLEAIKKELEEWEDVEDA